MRKISLNGTLCNLPGDKSISHRALFIASLCQGTTSISGLNHGKDVQRTAQALRALGISLSWTPEEDNKCLISSKGIASFKPATTSLNMGNSGTTTRLLCGILAALPFESILFGDSSLSKRPMKRILTPLEAMGLSFKQLTSYSLPLMLYGNCQLRAITYAMPIASAQVKSALLLAGLNATGTTIITEPLATRDHTERLLTYLGATLIKNNQTISITGGQTLTAKDLRIPADPSAAAFFAVGALITPNSHIILKNICWNPSRNAIFRILKNMGGDLTWSEERNVCGEPVVDLQVRSSSLKGIELDAKMTPSLIDEYPILSIAAACAEGISRFHGLEELRFKESDRLSAISRNLQLCGVSTNIQENSLHIKGKENGNQIEGGCLIQANLDHRIAMSFLILNLVSKNKIAIDDIETIATSNPTFLQSLQVLINKPLL